MSNKTRVMAMFGALTTLAGVITLLNISSNMTLMAMTGLALTLIGITISVKTAAQATDIAYALGKRDAEHTLAELQDLPLGAYATICQTQCSSYKHIGIVKSKDTYSMVQSSLPLHNGFEVEPPQTERQIVEALALDQLSPDRNDIDNRLLELAPDPVSL